MHEVVDYGSAKFMFVVKATRSTKKLIEVATAEVGKLIWDDSRRERTDPPVTILDSI